MKKQTKYEPRVLTDEVWAGLVEATGYVAIEHAMIIAGNAYQSGGEKMAENAALLAMLIAKETGADVRRSAQIAWDAAEAIEEMRS